MIIVGDISPYIQICGYFERNFEVLVSFWYETSSILTEKEVNIKIKHEITNDSYYSGLRWDK